MNEPVNLLSELVGVQGEIMAIRDVKLTLSL